MNTLKKQSQVGSNTSFYQGTSYQEYVKKNQAKLLPKKVEY